MHRLSNSSLLSKTNNLQDNLIHQIPWNLLNQNSWNNTFQPMLHLHILTRWAPTTIVINGSFFTPIITGPKITGFACSYFIPIYNWIWDPPCITSFTYSVHLSSNHVSHIIYQVAAKSGHNPNLRKNASIWMACGVYHNHLKQPLKKRRNPESPRDNTWQSLGLI